METVSNEERLTLKQGISSVKDLLARGVHSNLGKNVLSLYVIQFANYIVPLIMVPYLVRVLGPAGYGAVAFAQGFMNYLVLFVEYGFSWSATRKISVLRENLVAVNRVALHVWAAKGLLSLAGLVVLGGLTFAVPKLWEVALLLVALYGLILGNVLFPTWLFQGMEQMVAISLINLGMKLSVLAGVFFLVRRPGDALLYASLLGGGSLLAGLTGAVVAFRMFGLRLTWVSAKEVWEVLKEGWVLFLSKASVSLYTAGNAFILGMLTNYTVVGYYSVAEKLAKAATALIEPVAQAAYPAFAKKAAESRPQALMWARKGLILQGTIGALLTLSLWFGAPILVGHLFGKAYANSVPILRILSLFPLLIAVGSSIGRFVMLPFHMDVERLIVFTFAGVANITLGVLLSLLWQGTGMATSAVISEFAVTFGFLWMVHGRNLNPLWQPGEQE